MHAWRALASRLARHPDRLIHLAPRPDPGAGDQRLRLSRRGDVGRHLGQAATESSSRRWHADRCWPHGLSGLPDVAALAADLLDHEVQAPGPKGLRFRRLHAR